MEINFEQLKKQMDEMLSEYKRALNNGDYAKAKDITEYVTDAIPTRFMDENGKKQHGYKLLNKDQRYEEQFINVPGQHFR